jgi:hypothetical protein
LFEGDCLRVLEFPHRLIFVRHGETAYNADRRLQGQLDIPLNARGREQARAVGGTLRSLVGPEIDRLDEARAFFASPLERARETMEIARDAMGLAPRRYRLDAVLKELSFGVWEGLTWSEIEVKDPKGLRARRADRWAFVPEGGESYAMLRGPPASVARRPERTRFCDFARRGRPSPYGADCGDSACEGGRRANHSREGYRI